MSERRNLVDKPIEERVSSLESSMVHIERDMGDIKNSISGGFKDLHERITDNAKDNKFHPNNWLTGAGVLLLIISLFGSIDTTIKFRYDIINKRLTELENKTDG
jgi:hypothetical protein